MLKPNPTTGLVDSPVYPCYKSEGTCKLRVLDSDKFQCLFEPQACRYRLQAKVLDIPKPEERKEG